MPDAFDRCIDATFRAFGVAASHTPSGGGAPAAVTVIPVLADPTLAALDGATRLKGEGGLFELRAADVPAPGPGDSLIVAGAAYKVSSARAKDPLKKIFVLDCRKA